METVSRVVAIKRYLESNGGAKVSAAEFMAFKKDCTPEQLDAYACVSAANLGVELAPNASE